MQPVEDKKPQPKTEQKKPSARGGTSLTAIGDNTFLLVAGADRQPMEFNDLWLLKVIVDKDSGKCKFGWKQLPEEKNFQPRTGHSACFYKGKVYIYGGQNYRNNSHTSELWQFDPHLQKFERLDTINTPAPRNSHGACVDPNTGIMYVFGGANDNGLLREFYQLDLNTLQWTKLDIDKEIHTMQMLTLHFHKEAIYFIGGLSDENSEDPNHQPIGKSISRYCPSTKEWTPKVKKLPAHLCSSASAFVGEDLYIIGGLTPAGFSDCIYRVDFEKMRSQQVLIEKFTKEDPETSSLIQMIASSCAVTDDGSHLISFGGSTYDGETNIVFAVDLKRFKEIEEDVTKNIAL